MATRLQRRRNTTGALDLFVGAEAETVIDTTKRTYRVCDGETPGGAPASETVVLSSIKELGQLPPGFLRTDRQYSAPSFWPGFNLGGGTHVWNPDRPKADHTGGTVTDPDKLSELGLPSDVDPFGTYFTANTEGFGCFEVISETQLDLTDFGGLPGDFDNSGPIKQWLVSASLINSLATCSLDEVKYAEEIDVDLQGRDLSIDAKCFFFDEGREIPAQPSGFTDTALGIHISNGGHVELGTIKLRNEFRTELTTLSDLVNDRLTQFKVELAKQVKGRVIIDGNMGAVIGISELVAAGKSSLAPLFTVCNISQVDNVDLENTTYEQTEGETLTFFQCKNVMIDGSTYKQAAGQPGYYSFSKIIDCGNATIKSINSESRSTGSFNDVIVDRLTYENITLDQPTGKFLDISFEWGALNRPIGDIYIKNCKSISEVGIFTSLGGGYVPVEGDGVGSLSVRDYTQIFGDTGYRAAVDNAAVRGTNINGLTTVNARSIIGGTGRGLWREIIGPVSDCVKNLDVSFTFPDVVDSCRIFAHGSLDVDGFDIDGEGCPRIIIANESPDGVVKLSNGSFKNCLIQLNGNVKFKKVELDNVRFVFEEISAFPDADFVNLELEDCDWKLQYGTTEAASRNFNGELFSNNGITPSNISVKSINTDIKGLMRTRFGPVFGVELESSSIKFVGGELSFNTSADGSAIRSRTDMVYFAHQMGDCDFYFYDVSVLSRISLLTINADEDPASANTQKCRIIECKGLPDYGSSTHGYVFVNGSVSPWSNAVVSDIDLILVGNTFARLTGALSSLFTDAVFSKLVNERNTYLF